MNLSLLCLIAVFKQVTQGGADNQWIVRQKQQRTFFFKENLSGY